MEVHNADAPAFVIWFDNEVGVILKFADGCKFLLGHIAPLWS